ncbi:DNA-processing protein DprA [Actinosynnema sp. CS-041913]|uniref:DNA-processing protein DprA n=1 Tax=Actinosynnema sp. CS-041913 TaxID=3239917 RepID=UPI003D911493
MSLTSAELRALLYLLRAAEPPSPALHDYVAVCGVVEAVAHIRSGDAPSAVLAEIVRPDVDIARDLTALDTGTARLVTPHDQEWPRDRFDAMAVHDLGVPLALWVRGRSSLAELLGTAVTITGARAATEYGSFVAAELAADLARRGVTVVGGGAYGIEGCAHRGALAGDGATVVVMPCGIDQRFPREHGYLFESVVERGGLVVGEYPVGTVPARRRFYARNRLLAGLASATLLVEAGKRSKTLFTAQVASSLGRPVYGVPGPVTSALSGGVHELLRTGQATIATTAGHIDVPDGSPRPTSGA